MDFIIQSTLSMPPEAFAVAARGLQSVAVVAILEQVNSHLSLTLGSQVLLVSDIVEASVN